MVQQFVRAPSDEWVNTTTGKTIIVRGEFQQTYTRVPGTDEFTVTIVGHRYMVNEPGLGVTVQEVGRIIYADPSEETILAMAGQGHDLADQDLIHHHALPARWRCWRFATANPSRPPFQEAGRSSSVPAYDSHAPSAPGNEAGGRRGRAPPCGPAGTFTTWQTHVQARRPCPPTCLKHRFATVIQGQQRWNRRRC